MAENKIPFIRTTRPEYGNPYFNTRGAGGYIDATIPKNFEPGMNILPNCVGLATGCFNETINSIKKENRQYYPLGVGPARLINVARSYDLEIRDFNQAPTLGSIMVFLTSIHGIFVGRHPAGERILLFLDLRLADQGHGNVILREPVTELFQGMMAPERQCHGFSLFPGIHDQNGNQLPEHLHVHVVVAFLVFRQIGQTVREEQEGCGIREIIFHIVFVAVNRVFQHAQRQTSFVFGIPCHGLWA